MKDSQEFRLYKNVWMLRENPHLSQEIKAEEAKKMLDGGGLCVRNIYSWDMPEKKEFWYLVKDDYGGVEELPAKVRNQVRKALKTYEYRRVSGKEMLEKGYEVYKQSRARFGSSVSYEQFARRCENVKQDFWLGIHRETDKAECLAFNKPYADYCDYVSMGVNPDAPKSTYPMYGLILEMNRYYLEELGLKYVMDGARSITEHSNIQPFLEEKFKFRKAYCELQIFYNKRIGMVVKLLFPFRRWIKNKKITAILRQEAWSRGLSE